MVEIFDEEFFFNHSVLRHVRTSKNVRQNQVNSSKTFMPMFLLSCKYVFVVVVVGKKKKKKEHFAELFIWHFYNFFFYAFDVNKCFKCCL